MAGPIDEIKARLDMVELVQTYLKLQKAGINFKANCPFHAEKTPSFFVSPARQTWHCFGCGKGGDMFKFVMEIEGLEFPEALKLLAGKAGIQLKREDPRIRSERNRLYDVCEEAARLFEKSLSLTPAVKAYLKKRGIADETIQRARIGFAPASWDFLLKKLMEKGFSREEVERAGLAVKSEDRGSWYDRFRFRIMFPVTDANGRVIGFGGRIFETPGVKKSDKEEAKYVNTPQTLIYDKSRVLYGLDAAKQVIREKNQVVVVEGYMDCIMSQQAGVLNTVAVSGTALTPHQLRMLRRLTNTMVSSFDTDLAGDSATRRSLALAAEFEFERRIAVIPSGKDPADAVLENPSEWLEAVAGAKPVVDFYFEKAFRDNDAATPQGKKTIGALLLPFVAELANEIERSHWISELARRLNVAEGAVWQELKRVRGEVSRGDGFASPRASEPPSRRRMIEERLLVLLTLIDEEIKKQELEKHHLVFTVPTHQELFGWLASPRAGEPADEAMRESLSLLRMKGEILADMTEDCVADFRACRRELELESVKERLLLLGDEIQRRERAGDSAGVAVLLRNFNELSGVLRSIE